MSARKPIGHGAPAILFIAAMGAASPAFAQNATAPKFVNVDSNNVDLTTGLVSLSIDEGGIGGSSESAVRMQRIWAQGAGWLDNWGGGLYKATSAA